MKIVSLSVGLPQTLTYFGHEVQTGGNKTPVAEAFLSRTGFAGDGQADLQNHGGPDKAVCVYPFEHYAFWENWLGEGLPPSAFSENWTTSGLVESEVCLGDVWRVGEVRVQVSQPRAPCSKLAGKRGQKVLPEKIHETSFSGFYLRVLEEGVVRAGDPVELLARDAAGVTIQFINQLYYYQRTTPEDFERALAVPALAEAGRRILTKRRTAVRG
ncbi:MAG: MOSC domain-containing protein [Anaerolineales bacterium]|nr:MOSC domain-containing protein [Anaerolineales bacterium]